MDKRQRYDCLYQTLATGLSLTADEWYEFTALDEELNGDDNMLHLQEGASG